MFDTTRARTFPPTVVLWNDAPRGERGHTHIPAQRTADRCVRLGRGRTDGAARAARAASARGLHLPRLHPIACAALAGIIQAGEQFDARATETVRSACAPLSEAGADTVILGCTHYPLIRPLLQRLLGPEVVLVSSGAALARQVEHVLSTRELGNPRSGEGAYRFLCTGDTDAFHELGARFLQMPLGVVEHVELAEAEAVA